MCDARKQGQNGEQPSVLSPFFCAHFWTKCPEAGAAGELDARLQGFMVVQRRLLFEQMGERFPQSFIVPLQRLDLLRVNTAVGVGLDRHLI